MRLEPGTRLDRFEIIEPVGEGAYAELYRARDGDSGDDVVLKCPNPNLLSDPGLFQRFQREGMIGRSLQHPGVQRSLEEHDTNTPYLVLEYIDGENFRKHLQSVDGGHVPVATAVDWGTQLASVLAYLHGLGVVHRDLKPENILITSDGQLKVLDFGSALLDGARRLTWRHLSESIGTPDYMSPEQIQGERGDHRSDIYAWGTMMYEFLTGRIPFPGDNWMAVMASHLTKNPEKIRSVNPSVSPELEAVVLKAMRRYPDHRYQDAAELLHDLEQLDSLHASDFDLSPEKPMGGMASADSEKKLWLLILLVVVLFITVVALIITLSVVL